MFVTYEHNNIMQNIVLNIFLSIFGISVFLKHINSFQGKDTLPLIILSDINIDLTGVILSCLKKNTQDMFVFIK